MNLHEINEYYLNYFIYVFSFMWEFASGILISSVPPQQDLARTFTSPAVVVKFSPPPESECGLCPARR